ncbi:MULTISPECIES: hypothetical protein [Massilia]|uniref:Uncharacterized protein n=1 Tax=Massilia haematophila TaxID=457923 RepID=A0ABV7PNZ0_9BURK|nr:hypothetical protein [Massilia sp.]
MRAASFVTLVFAATLAGTLTAPASAEMNLTASEASALSAVIVVASPFILSHQGGKKLSQAASGGLEGQKRWRVAALRPQGDKTAVALRSEDQTMQIDTMVATKTARSQGLKVDDELGIEPIGRSGYTLKKGATTIGVMTPPDSGLLHSKARG